MNNGVSMSLTGSEVVMDEVLGRNSFVADIVWQRTHTRENRTDISNVHDNIVSGVATPLGYRLSLL